MLNIEPTGAPLTPPPFVSEAALLGVGVVAGWLNTVAGGGSLLTVPALMWSGLPADIANGTSRIAILAQGITAVLAFRREQPVDTSLLLEIAAPSVVGALLGAYVATLISSAVLTPLIVVTLVVMAGAMFMKPSALAPPSTAQALRPRERPGSLAVLLLAGFYGGFLQAGVGLVLLAVFAGLLRIDLVRGNVLKAHVILVYSVVVVLVFALHARVAYAHGITLAIGQVIGTLLGVRFAVSRGQEAIKGVLFVVIIAMAIALLFRESRT